MRLSDAPIGRYIIKSVNASPKQKERLKSLLLFSGREIETLFVKGGKAVVSASGTVIGLSRSVCEKIEVAKSV